MVQDCMNGYEKLADQDLPRRRKLRYQYGKTIVTVDYEKDRRCLTLISALFTEFPQLPMELKSDVDAQYLTEFVRQRIGVEYEPDLYQVSIGGDPFIIVKIVPDAGITIRDMDGEVAEVILPRNTTEARA